MFRNEMSSQAKPSFDGLAQEVLSQGRRARRVRRAKIASTALVAVRRGRAHRPRGCDLDHRDLAGQLHPAAARGQGADEFRRRSG